MIKKKLENDIAHDVEHVMRVLNNARKIARKEKADLKIITAAALLHDLVTYPKSDPRTKNSSLESSKKSRIILKNNTFFFQIIRPPF